MVWFYYPKPISTNPDPESKKLQQETYDKLMGSTTKALYVAELAKDQTDPVVKKTVEVMQRPDFSAITYKDLTVDQRKQYITALNTGNKTALSNLNRVARQGGNVFAQVAVKVGNKFNPTVQKPVENLVAKVNAAKSGLNQKYSASKWLSGKPPQIAGTRKRKQACKRKQTRKH
jgi:hypothetical protein